MILIIDNYDSFTYNIFQYTSQLGYPTEVVRNDLVDAQSIFLEKYSAIILSPGPGTPQEAGNTMDVIRNLAGKIPILGVCLGHQAIAEVFGGEVVRAPKPVHGKVSPIHHHGKGIYQGVPNPFLAGRYHSLMVDPASLPDCLEVTAQTADGLIMGIKHCRVDVEGVQFHPESILTENGLVLIKNFLRKIN